MSNEPEKHPTLRFGDRVAYYVKYRPGYPAELIPLLERELELSAPAVVADVGAGTGKLSEPLLAAGHVVHAIEPNAEMRRASSELLGHDSRFHTVEGSAEQCGLPDGSVDLVVAAQAFHWFDVERARAEFLRILRPPAAVALIWNRRNEGTPFLRAYERLLKRRSIDYGKVDHRLTTDGGSLERFFGRAGFSRARLANAQFLDREALQGRALSSSYVPLAGQPGHDELMQELRSIFDAHQQDGLVRLEYETEVFWSRLSDRLADGNPR